MYPEPADRPDSAMTLLVQVAVTVARTPPNEIVGALVYALPGSVTVTPEMAPLVTTAVPVAEAVPDAPPPEKVTNGTELVKMLWLATIDTLPTTPRLVERGTTLAVKDGADAAPVPPEMVMLGGEV